jgi:hypothetical protein
MVSEPIRTLGSVVINNVGTPVVSSGQHPKFRWSRRFSDEALTVARGKEAISGTHND